MNLIIFDCDDTFWELPYDENDKYMKLPESLKYNFKYRQEIVDIYNERRKDPNNKFVILTNRTEKVQKIVLEKLKKEQDVEFDYYLFRNKDRNKSHRLKELLLSLKGVKLVEFYDDKQRHVDSVSKLRWYWRFLMITFKTYKV